MSLKAGVGCLLTPGMFQDLSNLSMAPLVPEIRKKVVSFLRNSLGKMLSKNFEEGNKDNSRNE